MWFTCSSLLWGISTPGVKTEAASAPSTLCEASQVLASVVELVSLSDSAILSQCARDDAVIQIHQKAMTLYNVTFSLPVFSQLYILRGDYPVRICNFYIKMVFSYKNVWSHCFVLKTQKAYKICKFLLFYYICVCFSHKSVSLVFFPAS